MTLVPEGEPNLRASVWKLLHNLGMALCAWSFRHLQAARGDGDTP